MILDDTWHMEGLSDGVKSWDPSDLKRLVVLQSVTLMIPMSKWVTRLILGILRIQERDSLITVYCITICILNPWHLKMWLNEVNCIVLYCVYVIFVKFEIILVTMNYFQIFDNKGWKLKNVQFCLWLSWQLSWLLIITHINLLFLRIPNITVGHNNIAI